MFLYGIHYYMKNVHSSHYIAGLLFFGYMAVVSFLFFVLTGPFDRIFVAALCSADVFAGFCGFVPTFFFVRSIFGAVKLD